MADPKTGTGKKPKGSGGGIRMRILKTLLELSLRLLLMLVKLLQKLKDI